MIKFEELYKKLTEEANLTTDVQTYKDKQPKTFKTNFLTFADKQKTAYMKHFRVKKICDHCGLELPISKGRYPEKCPKCGDLIAGDLEINLEAEQKEGGKVAYKKFFDQALKKFGYKADEIDELPDAKKKEFFDYIEKGWKAKNEK